MLQCSFVFDQNGWAGLESRKGWIADQVDIKLIFAGVVQGELETLGNEDGAAFVDRLGFTAA